MPKRLTNSRSTYKVSTRSHHNALSTAVKEMLPKRADISAVSWAAVRSHDKLRAAMLLIAKVRIRLLEVNERGRLATMISR